MCTYPLLSHIVGEPPKVHIPCLPLLPLFFFGVEYPKTLKDNLQDLKPLESSILLQTPCLVSWHRCRGKGSSLFNEMLINQMAGSSTSYHEFSVLHFTGTWLTKLLWKLTIQPSQTNTTPNIILHVSKEITCRRPSRQRNFMRLRLILPSPLP